MSGADSEDSRSQEVGTDPPPPGPQGAGDRQPSDLLEDVQALGRGEADEDAWGRIHDAYFGRVRSLFKRRGAAEEERRDLTQETFFRVFQGRGKFECTQEFEAWLFRIAANVWRNARRAAEAAKRNPFEESLDEWIDERGFAPRAAEPGLLERPLESLLEKERMVLLIREVQKLPPRMRQCLLLRLFQGLSYDQIARRLRLSVGAVKAHLHQARHRLNERLARHFLPVENGSSEEPASDE